MGRNQAAWLPFVLGATLALREADAQATLFSNEGLAGGDLFGACALRIGDVNGDLIEDLLVGAPNASPAGLPNAGEVAVMSGANGVRILTIPGSVALEKFGSALALISDVNANGFPEIVVGTPGAGGALQTGGVRILDGGTFAALGTIPGPSSNARFGERLAGLGDVNGDGFADFAVGAPGFNGMAGASAGAVYVLNGQNATQLRAFYGSAAFDALGSSIARCADLTQDGKPELVVGVPGFDSIAGSGAGRVRVFDPTNGAIVWTFDGPVASEAVGAAVDGAADIDLDGRGEVIAGAPGASPSGLALAGRGYVLGGVSGTAIATIDGLGIGDRLGSVVAGLGDLDADGRGDFALASQDATVNGNSGAGLVIAVRGGAFTPLYVFEGATAQAGIGGFVAEVGDANHDGRADFAIGSPFGDGFAGVNSGSIMVKAAQVGELTMGGSGQYGTPFTLSLQAMPSQPVFLLVDIASGSFPSPYGTIVVGFSPMLSVLPIGTLSSSGQLALAGVIPQGGPLAITFHLQALVAEPWSATGWRASSGAEFTVGP